MRPSVPASGFLRVFFFVGVIAAMVGFALWAFAVVATVVDFFSKFKAIAANDDPFAEPPMDFSLIVSLAPLAMGLIIGGLSLLSLCSLLAARADPPNVQHVTYGDWIGQNKVSVDGNSHVVHIGDSTRTNVQIDVSVVSENLRQLRIGIAGLSGLDPQTRLSIGADIEDALAATQQQIVDPRAVSSPLERITQKLKHSVGLLKAGAEVVDPLIKIGKALGPAGVALLQMLG